MVIGFPPPLKTAISTEVCSRNNHIKWMYAQGLGEPSTHGALVCTTTTLPDASAYLLAIFPAPRMLANKTILGFPFCGSSLTCAQ